MKKYRALLLLGLWLCCLPSSSWAQRSLSEIKRELNQASGARQKAQLQIEAAQQAYRERNYQASINYADQAIRTAQPLRDPDLSSMAFETLGTIYQQRNNYQRAIPYFERAIKLREGLFNQNKSRNLARNLSEDFQNLGVAYEQVGNISKFEESLRRAAVYARIFAKDHTLAARAYNTLGEAYRKRNKLEEARTAFRFAIDEATKAGMNSYRLEMQRKLDTINELIRERDAKQNKEKEVGLLLNNVSAQEEKLTLFQDSLESVSGQKDTLIKQKSLLELQKRVIESKLETERKRMEAEENALQAREAAAEAAIAQNAKLQAEREQIIIAAVGGGLLALVVIVFLVARSNARKQANRIIRAERDRSEQLLLNILPANVADELKEKDVVSPVRHRNVSILFTDFKSFSSIAENMNEEELVEELKHAFSAFDTITSKFHLEKIKTIGDAYMACAGLVEDDPFHAINAIAAGMAMQDFIKQWNQDQIRRGKTPWQLRVGIHSGEVVAGVVGDKKYAYDIWGKDVNLASRMESASEAGKVNVSASTYQLAKGMVRFGSKRTAYVKNIGEVDMYYVEEILARHTDPAPPPSDTKRRGALRRR
jgi:adenylate cyclase